MIENLVFCWLAFGTRRSLLLSVRTAQTAEGKNRHQKPNFHQF
jgi:hypothetical protein